jgi:hypothetical protein
LEALIAFAAIGGMAQPCPDAASCFQGLPDREQLLLLDGEQVITPGAYGTGAGLAGEDLYLFEDQTFLYVQWGDTLPPTVYDKGRWQLRDGILELKRAPDVTWAPVQHQRYVAVRGKQTPEAVALAGVDDDGWSLGHLHKKPSWKAGESAAVKRRLLRDAWNPSYWQSK